MASSLSSARRQTGLTVVEALMAAAVTATAASTVVPAVADLTLRQRVEAASNVLRAELQRARGHAVTLAEPVRVQIRTDAGGSCYVLHTGATDACTCTSDRGASCSEAAVVLGGATFGQQDGLRVKSNSRTLSFSGSFGTVTPTASIEVTGGRHAARAVVNVMGRVRQCTSTGSPRTLPAC